LQIVAQIREEEEKERKPSSLFTVKFILFFPSFLLCCLIKLI